MSEKVLEPRVYELGYHILPFVSSADLENEVQNIKNSVEKLGGNVFKDSFPSLIELAYEMVKVIDNKKQKFTQANFGWMKFELAQEKVSEFKKYLDSNKNFLRYLLVLTVKEDTYIETKKEESDIVSSEEEISITEEEPRKEAHDKIVIPEEDINKEEIDKQIDGMVD